MYTMPKCCVYMMESLEKCCQVVSVMNTETKT